MKKQNVKVNFKNLKREKTATIFFQILNLIISTFAISFIIASASAALESKVVSAADATLTWNTCYKSKKGELCQEFESSICAEKCATSCFPGKRDEYSDCKLGCCFDSSEGLCDPMAPKRLCEDKNGKWFGNEKCEINECKLGCCVLGTKTELVTKKRCENLANFAGIPAAFSSSIGELGCKIVEEYAETAVGSCVLESGITRTCKLTTAVECRKLTGKLIFGNENFTTENITGNITRKPNFYPNLLCSNPSLETNCKKQIRTGCAEGKDEVYWFDSCGNIENIYSSDKDKSWNNGKLLIKRESCGTGSNNANSIDCGNCNVFLGSKCSLYEPGKQKKPKYGDYACKDLSCTDEKGKKWKNSESWCAYEGAVGEGKDIVGSRHWRYSCTDGEVKVEGCSDYRQEICVESNAAESSNSTGNKTISTTGDFSTAVCRMNNWRSCIDANTKKSKKGKITECPSIDCDKKKVNIDKGFKFDTCTPKNPPGWDLEDKTRGESGKQICGMASQKCTVVYEKKLSGWKCVVNCKCETKKFTEEMNDFCMSLGDCGAEVNIAGKVTTEGYSVKKAPKLSQSYLDKLKSYALFSKDKMIANASDPSEIAKLYGQPVVGFTSVPGALGTAVAAVANTIAKSGAPPLPVPGATATPNQNTNTSSITGGVTGRAVTITGGYIPGPFSSGGGSSVGGTAATEVGISAPVAEGGLMSASNANALAYGTIGPSQGAATVPWYQSPVVSGFMNVISGIGIGMMAGGLIAMVFGLKGQSAMIVTAVGAVGGAVLGVWAAVSPTQTLSSLIFGLPGIIVLVILIIIAAILKAMKIGETKKVKVQFNCMPWQAPSGNTDCHICNENPLKPCTKYRCNSLGKACEFKVLDSGETFCNALENDGKSPVISPWNEFLTEEFKYENVNSNGFKIRSNDGSCIPAFTPLQFGILTDEKAQCKVDSVENAAYDEMEDYFGDNFYKTNHSIVTYMPSKDATTETIMQETGLNETNVNESEKKSILNLLLNKSGNLDLSVKCQDVFGNKNVKDYKINICVKEGKDYSEPKIIRTEPENNAKIGQMLSEKDVLIAVNEPAECKFSLQDKSYTEMENSMNCITDLDEFVGIGWLCNFTMPLKSINESLQSKVFIRCKDQPWLIGNRSSERNTNTKSYEYVLEKTQEQLKIDRITPNGTIIIGYEPFSLDLEVETSGGVDNGISKCEYSFDNSTDKRYTMFYDTFSDKHKQTLSQMLSGLYRVYILCEDEAGNIAESNSTFAIQVDAYSPFITRVYYENGLKIITNENAECAYSNQNCLFDFENGTLMQTEQNIHTAEWNRETTYYIKCKDVFGNVPTYCSIIVKPAEIPWYA